MFLRKVAPPIINEDKKVEFGGKIFMRSVSKTVEQAGASTKKNFDYFYLQNHKRKLGEWKLMIFSNEKKTSELIQHMCIVLKYKIKDSVAKCLVFNIICFSS